MSILQSKRLHFKWRDEGMILIECLTEKLEKSRSREKLCHSGRIFQGIYPRREASHWFCCRQKDLCGSIVSKILSEWQMILSDRDPRNLFLLILGMNPSQSIKSYSFVRHSTVSQDDKVIRWVAISPCHPVTLSPLHRHDHTHHHPPLAHRPTERSLSFFAA